MAYRRQNASHLKIRFRLSMRASVAKRVELRKCYSLRLDCFCFCLGEDPMCRSYCAHLHKIYAESHVGEAWLFSKPKYRGKCTRSHSKTIKC